MKLLDLFCGAGGAAMGYHRAGFHEIVGVDHAHQPRYPFEFVEADALAFVSEHGHEFDVIHASPPCQAYTGMRRITEARYGECSTEHPDLIAGTQRALGRTGKIYVIENVPSSPLHTQFILCGTSLGLEYVVRHRHFESNVLFLGVPPCTHHHKDTMTIGVYGSKPDGRRVSYRHHKFSRIAQSLEEARQIMGIDWMTWDEIKEAIPPVYTEWIGRRLIETLKEESCKQS